MSLAESIAHWSMHQVADLPLDITAEQSLAALEARNAVYPGLLELMPTNKPGLTVLDFGCGPGHDVIGFMVNGARHVYAVDVSPKARAMTRARLKAHGYEMLCAVGGWLPTKLRFDHIHTAGVIHHTPYPVLVLRRLGEMCDGEIRMMVYDRDSDFYQRECGGDHATFMRRADGDAPITNAWTRDEVVSICKAAGLRAAYVGSYRHPGEVSGPGLSSCWSLTPCDDGEPRCPLCGSETYLDTLMVLGQSERVCCDPKCSWDGLVVESW